MENILWERFNVYHEVLDENQQNGSLLKTEKENVKACLVVWGFEEQINEPSNSKTTTKDTARLFFALCSSLSLNKECVNIKPAPLRQDKIKNDLFIKPLPETFVAPEIIWKLNKVLYGLGNTSRDWVFSVNNEFILLNCIQSGFELIFEELNQKNYVKKVLVLVLHEGPQWSGLGKGQYFDTVYTVYFSEIQSPM